MSNVAPSKAATAVPAADSLAVSADHPFSDPVYFPIHASARVSCMKSNCPGPYHNVWAMDLDAPRGTPVYAAGSGVFHVGGNHPGCSTVDDEINGGVWGWVDHGGGKVSKYYHFDSLVATDGQLVTPATVIGKVGSSGDVSPCLTTYLHFEVRSGGIYGSRIYWGQLKACVNGREELWPSALPGSHSNWNDVPAHTISTPVTTSDCIGQPALSTSARPDLAARAGNAAVTVRWTAPTAPASSVVIKQEIYRPSKGAYSTAAVYTTLPATARSYTARQLLNGYRYRYTVAYHGPTGWSAWSPARLGYPKTLPSVPRVPRWLLSSKTHVRFAWYRSAVHGDPVTRYQVAYRPLVKGKYRAWHYVSTNGSTYRVVLTGLKKGTRYQVTVRARSSLGKTAWAPRHSIRTKR
ncbi:MAG: fibronectin type III domain-containing protein [Angustibacter sp.]